MEFAEFAYPGGAWDPDVPREQLVNRFVDHLQPSLKLAIHDAQAAADLAWEARQEAQDYLQAAEIALRGANAQDDSDEKSRKVKTADVKAKTKALAAAKKAADAADKKVVDREVALEYHQKLRADFFATISLIVDPTVTTEQLATDTVGALCNVLSFYLSGKALGVVGADMDSPPTSCRRFAGRIQREWTPPRKSKLVEGDVEPGFHGSGCTAGRAPTPGASARSRRPGSRTACRTITNCPPAARRCWPSYASSPTPARTTRISARR